MCLATPMQITKIISEGQAMAEMNGVNLSVNIDLLDDVQKGDYVLVHVGIAMAKISPEKAKETLGLIYGDMEKESLK